MMKRDFLLNGLVCLVCTSIVSYTKASEDPKRECICENAASVAQLVSDIQKLFLPSIDRRNATTELEKINKYLQEHVSFHCINTVKEAFVRTRTEYLAQLPFTTISGGELGLLIQIHFDGSTLYYRQQPDGSTSFVKALPPTEPWTGLDFEQLIRLYGQRKSEQASVFNLQCKSPGSESTCSDSSGCGSPSFDTPSRKPE